jgi:8-oxo-dGTP pyrophosphatase MutT (NUDIX family)
MNEEARDIYPQSAAVPFRIQNGRPRILLITTRRRGRWIVPKGIIEEGQSPEKAALDEAFEEAGVKGSLIGDTVGEYEYRKWGGTCRVAVYLLRVEEECEDWPESHLRERRWVSVAEALDLIDNADLREVVQRAAQYMSGEGMGG